MLAWLIVILILAHGITVRPTEELRGSVLYLDNARYPKYPEPLLLFISITSGPHHVALRETIRSSWIEPCRSSATCDYRFFVDVPSKYYTKELLHENATYNDMVFRDFCHLMDKHPTTVNYVNTAPADTNLFFIDNDNNALPNPDYETRRYYKIDWKVCFMRWSILNHRSADYHVFVEDDSFICTGNLLHQCGLLRKIQEHHSSQNRPHHGNTIGLTSIPPAFLPFRTGSPNFWRADAGFDDSSTFMSGSIAKAFATYYRTTANFDCNTIHNTSFTNFNVLASWGNSWRPSSCYWREVLRTNEHTKMDINLPLMNCSEGLVVGSDPSRYSSCPSLPLIFHLHTGGEYILSLYPPGSSGLSHLCENMLLLDKVKNTSMMMQLWRETTVKESRFKDFSSVFTHDGAEGWPEALMKIKN